MRSMSIVKVYGYTRCSTADQASEGLSLDAQRARIEAWADATGALVEEIIEDAGISGSRPLVERPGGSRIAALLNARRPSVDAVVVVRLDRLGRDASESLACLRRFTRGDVGPISITDRIDLGTPTGRAMAQMTFVFAELERSLIAQRTADALAELRAQRRIYGRIPFGYEAHEDRLVPDPEEQKVLARIIQWRERGEGYHRIAARLNSMNIRAKRGGRWHSTSVRSVVRTSARLEPMPA
jgi:site-specific DNA recombinase